MSSRRMLILMVLVLSVGLGLELILWRYPELVGTVAGADLHSTWMLATAMATMLLVVLLASQLILGRRVGEFSYRQVLADDVEASSAVALQTTEHRHDLDRLTESLSDRHGRFWKRRVCIYLVVGGTREVEAIAPGLMHAGWLEGQGVLLLVESLAGDQAATAKFLRSLRPSRPLDGIVWALSPAQSADPEYVDRYQYQLQALARQLRWQAPTHLWEVHESHWAQPAFASAVGCALPLNAGAEQLEGQLSHLLPTLREQGLARMELDNRNDGLLRLARELQTEGIHRLRMVWARLRRSSGVMLRGLWFSLPLPPSHRPGDHHWLAHPAWNGILSVPHPRGRPHGWTWSRTASTALLGLAAFCGVGMLVSFAGNRAQIAEMQAVLATLDQPREGDEQLLALNALVHELDRLDQRARHGVPWYQRFGLSQNDGLLAALWPRYEAANNRLVRDPAAAGFERQLRGLLGLAPGSAERATRAREAYEPLKAYLMMARPENVDASFLGKALAAAEPARMGIGEGTWQGIAPNLWRFYAAQLEAHPGWRITTDPALVARARQLLISQLGQRNGEAALYRQVLDAVANQYPAMGLQQMVGDTDAQPLFSTAAEVPGVFTRQAWEGGVRKAIDEIAAARREEIDWVLSDDRSQIDAALTPEALRESLTARYFQDYGRAWLDMLNSLRWQEAGSLADVVDQLTLMTDVRQSPFIALVNTLSYQGRAGTRGQALGESLLQSAQNLMGPDKAPAIEPLAALPKGPLEERFGPLLALLGKGAEPSRNDDNLSLHAFLTRVTRVRLTLQQVSAAQDPQAMIQALAQTVFQGRSVDLTDTQSYGSLIAASLGSEWAGFGRALFVQPLDQAWQRILQPSAAGLNDHWQRAIVGPWNSAFAGRYPFAASASDASLPMLGQMIRADSGHIDRFLTRQLGGVLRKDGNRWVPESTQGQGLRLDPAFLAAVNRLAELADVLYTDGGMGIAFELRAKPVRDLVQTTLTLDGHRLAYFNQRERWQRFDWPSASDHPGARLSWTHARSGERLLGDYAGTWGLIRLLERARVTPLDDSETRYRLVLEAPDGLGLTWHLRTDLGAGPLALLQLRGFSLPARIFLEPGGASRQLAHYGEQP
ncbi:type VI secretion protein VasK [Pseudomonas solani]|uniref:Type VI secretion protein VasK n=11 Tax=Pseudomonas TaxID=286 RepID=A0ABM7L781_9PSED|nr:ImcF-related family protein [Pseudomonas solani]BCD85401.1 type VI secretion protein VasK [Pseudomonas solani]